MRSRVRPGNRVAVEIRRDPAKSATPESLVLSSGFARGPPQIRSSDSGIGAQKDRYQYDGSGAPDGSEAYSHARLYSNAAASDGCEACALAHRSMHYIRE